MPAERADVCAMLSNKTVVVNRILYFGIVDPRIIPSWLKSIVIFRGYKTETDDFTTQVFMMLIRFFPDTEFQKTTCPAIGHNFHRPNSHALLISEISVTEQAAHRKWEN